MIRTAHVALFVIMLCALTVHADPLLFRASFDDGTTPEKALGGGEPLFLSRTDSGPGKLGQCAVVPRGSQLIYEGLGNVYTAAGTVCFFWRPDADPDGKGFTVLDMSPLERINYSRWIRLSYGGGRIGLYFTAGNAGKKSISGGLKQPFKEGEWRHIAVAWDRTRGMAVYVDGVRIMQWESEWIYDGNVNAIGLGITTRPDFRPGSAGFSQSYDELRVYDRWLDDAALAALVEGKEPEIGDADPAAYLALKRKVYSWENVDGLPSLAVAPAAVGGGLKQTGVDTARDVLRTNWRAFDGERGRRWPGGAGYVNAGQRLDILLFPEERLDVIQIYGTGPVSVVNADAEDQEILDVPVRPEMPVCHVRTVLPEPIASRKMALARSGGVVYEARMFLRTEHDPLSERNEAGWERFVLVSKPPAEAPPERQHVLLTSYPPDQGTLYARQGNRAPYKFGAMRTVHLLGPSSDERRGLSAIALDFMIVAGDLPMPMRIEVIDPLSYFRYAATADVALTGTAPGRLRFTFDIRDMVLQSGARPHVAVTFGNDVAAIPHIAFRWIAPEDALPEYAHDQLARAKDIFQEISESRPWGYPPRRIKTLGILQRGINDLKALKPDDPEIAGYWHWIHPNDQKPIVELPPVPEGVPAWAVYMDRSIDLLREVPYWWIDHRQTALGEFGANDGVNDDTVIIQDWMPIALMRGPDSKLLESVRKVADRSWVRGMSESGLGHPTDMLHMYEWGINAQSALAVFDYGNPVRVERLMATARYYERVMGVTELGHRHFRSHRIGYNQRNPDEPYIRTDPGTDEGVNALLMQPGMLLAWYNGEPTCTKLLVEWADAWLAHYNTHIEKDGRMAVTIRSVQFETEKETTGRGFGYGFMDVPWAAYECSREKRFMDFIGHAIRYDTTVYHVRMPWVTSTVAVRYLMETGDVSLAERFKSICADEKIWKRSLHNSTYHEMDSFIYAYICTGDVKYIDEGARLLCNDMTWELPMLTHAEQSTDRVWLPLRFANSVVLGDISMRRNELFPKHAVSWEHASGRVVPFVKHADRRRLELWLYNLEEREATVDMRVWRLDHGKYAYEIGLDQDQDGTFDGEPKKGARELARYDVFPLTVPARSLLFATFRMAQPMDDIRLRADLAVCADDATYDPETGTLTVVVHNIGSKPTGAYRVVVKTGDRTLLEKEMPSLEPPVDLEPKTVSIQVTDLKADANTPVVVSLDPEAHIPEITEVNNTVTLDLAGLKAPTRQE